MTLRTKLMVRAVTEDGKPLSNVTPILHDEDGNVTVSSVGTSSSEEGLYELGALLSGTYRLTVQHADYAPSSVTVEAGGDAPPPTIVLRPGGYAQFEVRDRKGGLEGSPVSSSTTTDWTC